MLALSQTFKLLSRSATYYDGKINFVDHLLAYYVKDYILAHNFTVVLSSSQHLQNLLSILVYCFFYIVAFT